MIYDCSNRPNHELPTTGCWNDQGHSVLRKCWSRLSWCPFLGEGGRRTELMRGSLRPPTGVRARTHGSSVPSARPPARQGISGKTTTSNCGFNHAIVLVSSQLRTKGLMATWLSRACVRDLDMIRCANCKPPKIAPWNPFWSRKEQSKFLVA